VSANARPPTWGRRFCPSYEETLRRRARLL
jgi:hypothetical protein